MPTTYTHYKFAQEVRESLPEELQEMTARHPDLYYMGAMGPDLLFYSLPSMHTFNVSSSTHRRTGKDWFRFVGERLLNSNMEERQLVYLYGFLTHYAADRACHAYINQCAAEGKGSHYLIEAEWDRYYLVRDGFNPLKKKLTDHIVVSRKNAKMIAGYYPMLTPGWIYACMIGSHILLDGLVMTSEVKRFGLNRIADLADKVVPGSGSMCKDMAIAKKPVASCQPVCEELHKMLFQSALPDAVDFITSYQDLITGKKEWDARFNVDFEGIDHGEE